MFTDFQEIRPHYRLSIEVFMPIPMRRFGVFGMGVVRKRILGWQCPLVSGKCDTLAVCVMMESDQAPAPASDDGVRPSSEHWAHPGTHEQSVAARPHTSSRVTDSMKFCIFKCHQCQFDEWMPSYEGDTDVVFYVWCLAFLLMFNSFTRYYFAL